ncbi:Protein of unknown function DUF262 [Cellulomonas marina]|uniref:GmrSD restriction endonucleases N-terminal domain-containing protein n=2 Tax=Cellulomonas marina TaxID=988821 RepID=A0A1I0X9H0_9CELL|nr:Protein of unknown function DUF262 [Cellulomonas marina]
MDTIFKNYPSPAVFLHKTIDFATGESMYHVVDGKQRISTVLMFLANKVYLPKEFGDLRFDGKRWRDLTDDEAKSRLWNYRVTIEEVDDVSPTFVQEVFERLNKNSRKLTPQELRHARFDGWMIRFLEEEAAQPIWTVFKINTAAKEKRMTDVQNLAELAMTVMRRRVSGFDQEDIDSFFAEYDEVEADESDFDVDDFRRHFFAVRDWLADLDRETGVVAQVAQPFMHFYTLWAYVARLPEKPVDHAAFGDAYRRFMRAVGQYEVDPAREVAEGGMPDPSDTYDDWVRRYKLASRGATTEEPQRQARLEALAQALTLAPTVP